MCREPRWREDGLFQAYTVDWKSRNEAKRKKITSALERPGSAHVARPRPGGALGARPRPGGALVARPGYPDGGKVRF